MSKTEKQAMEFIKDLNEVIEDFRKDRIPGGDAMCWLVNNKDKVNLIAGILRKKSTKVKS